MYVYTLQVVRMLVCYHATECLGHSDTLHMCMYDRVQLYTYDILPSGIRTIIGVYTLGCENTRIIPRGIQVILTPYIPAAYKGLFCESIGLFIHIYIYIGCENRCMKICDGIYVYFDTLHIYIYVCIDTYTQGVRTDV